MDYSDIPNPFQIIVSRIEALSEKLDGAIGKNLNADGLPKDEFMKIDAAAEYLGLTVSTLHTYTRKNTIKHYKRGGRLYFSVDDINQFIRQGRVLQNDGKVNKRR